MDRRHVAGISRISALRRTSRLIGHREGGDRSSSRPSPGATAFESITLVRGVTDELDFEGVRDIGRTCGHA